jgi:hypothetical protein
MNNAWDKKGKPSDENMSGMWSPFHLAKKMGEGLGRSEILQQKVQRLIIQPEVFKIICPGKGRSRPALPRTYDQRDN